MKWVQLLGLQLSKKSQSVTLNTVIWARRQSFLSRLSSVTSLLLVASSTMERQGHRRHYSNKSTNETGATKISGGRQKHPEFAQFTFLTFLNRENGANCSHHKHSDEKNYLRVMQKTAALESKQLFCVPVSTERPCVSAKATTSKCLSWQHKI